MRKERPREFEVEVIGDLTGKGVWTFTPATWASTFTFDWRVLADRPLLRVLTPALRPLFRWNHNWSIQRAMEGLEAYARSRAVQEAGPPREQ